MMNNATHRVAAASGAGATSVAVQRTTLVTFQLAYQQYGLPLQDVIEIVRLPALVNLVGAAPMLCGLLNLRGQYVPVLDGRTLVGESPHYDLTSQIILVGCERPELGLLVDQVREVCTVTADQITPITQHAAAPFLSSVCTAADGSILIFNPPVLRTLALRATKRKAPTTAKHR